MTRWTGLRLLIKLAAMFSGLIMMTGGADELSGYLSLGWQRLLGSVLFFGFGWWLYRWLKFHVQYERLRSPDYNKPVDFNHHHVNGL
jgi:hypothetical protein